MFKNYIKIAVRSLKKTKGFTTINILGLALGLSAFLLITLYVIDELSYDRFNAKANRIYRTNNDIKFGGREASYATSPAPLAAAIKAEFPEVEQTVRFRQIGGFRIKKGAQDIQENNVTYADPQIFSVFSFPMILGNAADALKEPHTVVVTETTAKKYFNTVDAVGKTLTINDSSVYKVTGVINDIPRQSHLRFDLFMSMASLAESRENVWFNNNFQTYVLLKSGTDVKKFDAKLPGFVKEHINPLVQQLFHMDYDQLAANGSYFKINTIPLKDIHLHSNRLSELGKNGNIQYVYIFMAIAIFILLIACVNFMNLSTARSANRAREVGVRKALGSNRRQLIAQFLAESMIVTLVAMIIALIAGILLLPIFNQIADKKLAITAATMVWLLPAIVVLVIIIGLLAGSYPAFFLSAYQPIEVLKGKLASGFKGGFLRSFLVVFQFSISVFLIIGTLIIYNQLKFIQQKDLGYSRDNVVVIKNLSSMGSSAAIFKKEIKQMPGVINASNTGFTPTSSWGNSNTIYRAPTLGSQSAMNTEVWGVDEDYLPTFKMKLITGRNFSAEMPTDSSAIVINEAAARQIGANNPVGKSLYDPQDPAGKVVKIYNIIGVVKDFNFRSLRNNVTPMIMKLNVNDGALSIRVNSGNITSLMNMIENKWKAMVPNQEFEYSFMDQDFDAIYRTEQRIGKIFITFTTLAIIIACLGLFGLAAYAAEQRNKEIGIRKVLGAGLSSIVGMLTADFIKLVVIAIIIAAPLAWLAMQKWLEGFAYRQSIQWWVIAVAGTGAILIAFITISFQSVKAALINPVKSLRSE